MTEHLSQFLLQSLEERMAYATACYGPFASTHEALGVALEEWNELQAAIQANNLDAVKRECVDLAAVVLRLVNNLNDLPKLRERSVKR
jgi:hypothetical protein